MWFIILILSLWGLLAVYSSVSWLAYKNKSSTFFYLFQHVFFIFLGFVIMLYIHTIHYKNFMGIARFLLYASYILLVATILFGVTINGAKRWISFGVFTFQSSDFSKVAILLYTIRTLAKYKDNLDDVKKVILPLFGHITLTCLLIAKDNLSTAAVLFATCFLVVFLGRVKVLNLLKIGAFYIAACLLFISFLVFVPPSLVKNLGRVGTWQMRIKTFAGNNNNETQDNFQANHAKIAIATGGLLGKGPGQSVERNFLPEAYADFIYAIIIEEYGLIFGVIMLVFYLWFMYRTINIIRQAPKAFGALIAVGLSFQLVLQALINMAVAVGLFPVTGLTLPLVSKGGTSLVFTFITLGLIMSVSRHIESEKSEENDEVAHSTNNNFITV
ncbi:MAG: FtsW/RodA/SpoVE family cell cycle protein [Bacteroidota bacterium]